MRALTGNEIEPTLTVREARAGDRYLLCSDGLSDVVSDETIANTMREGTNDECADGSSNWPCAVADGQRHRHRRRRHRPRLRAESPDRRWCGVRRGGGHASPEHGGGAGRGDAPAARGAQRVAPTPEAPPKKSHKLRWTLIGLGLVVLLIAGLFVAGT